MSVRPVNHQMLKKYGKHRKYAALTENQIISVYKRFHSGDSSREIAKEYGCGKSTICRIANGQLFSDITGHSSNIKLNVPQWRAMEVKDGPK